MADTLYKKKRLMEKEEKNNNKKNRLRVHYTIKTHLIFFQS